MKQLSLTTIYLTVASTLAFAQLPNPLPSADGPSSLMPLDGRASAQPTQHRDEFTPLNNFPFFPGGQQGLETYLQQLDLYPRQARKAHLEGTVWVRFRVLPTGHLNEVRVVQSRGLLLDQAAIQTVAFMPGWYPAHREGVAVSSQVELPVTFRLN